MPLTMGVIHIPIPDVLRDKKRIDAATKEAARETGHGAEWRCLVAQSQIVYAFSSISLDAVAPEHMSWVTILLRAFHCIEGARALLSRHADVAAEVLLRVAAEIRLHQMIIRKPWEDHLVAGGTDDGSGPSVEAWDAVRGRLQAYAAWAIASDLEFTNGRLDNRELGGMFAGTPAPSLPQTEGEAALLRFVFGASEIVSPQEAAADRRRVERNLRKDQRRLQLWLRDDRIAPWAKRIEEIKSRNRGWVPSNFGQLFADQEYSFAKSLQALDLRHEYAWYARSSRIIHGNTFELFNWGTGPSKTENLVIVPRSVPHADDARSYVTDVANLLSQVAAYMWALGVKTLRPSRSQHAPLSRRGFLPPIGGRGG